MPETRKRFHDELAALESELARPRRARSAGGRQRRSRALVSRTTQLADAGHHRRTTPVDATYLDIEQPHPATCWPRRRRWRPTSGWSRPSCTRTCTSSGLGDQAVNIAKITKATMDLPSSDEVVSQLEEMGEVVARMMRTSMRGLRPTGRRPRGELPELDDPVDRLNRNMYRRGGRPGRRSPAPRVGHPDERGLPTARAGGRQRRGHRRAGRLPAHRRVPRVHRRLAPGRLEAPMEPDERLSRPAERRARSSWSRTSTALAETSSYNLEPEGFAVVAAADGGAGAGAVPRRALLPS